MDIKTCRECGKLFQYRGTYICPDCTRKLDDLFVKVRNYMYENPSATIETICDDNEVSVEMVMGWLREGRLMVADNSVPLLKCAGCGKPISTGRMCVNCANSMATQISNTSKDMAKNIQQRKSSSDKRSIHGF